MKEIYEEIYSIMSDLERVRGLLEMMLLNGENETANHYIEGAMPYMDRALGWLSDAEFEISTTADDYTTQGRDEETKTSLEDVGGR